MFEVENTFRVLAHRGAEPFMVSSYSKTSFSTSGVLLNGQQCLQAFVLELPAMKRHHRLAEAEEKPAHAVVRGTGGAMQTAPDCS